MCHQGLHCQGGIGWHFGLQPCRLGYYKVSLFFPIQLEWYLVIYLQYSKTNTNITSVDTLLNLFWYCTAGEAKNKIIFFKTKTNNQNLLCLPRFSRSFHNVLFFTRQWLHSLHNLKPSHQVEVFSSAALLKKTFSREILMLKEAVFNLSSSKDLFLSVFLLNLKENLGTILGMLTTKTEYSCNWRCLMLRA